MLIIGSQAMRHHGLTQRSPRDTDIICTFDEFKVESKRISKEKGLLRCVPLSERKFHIRTKDGWNYEFEIAWEGSSGSTLLKIENVVEGKVTIASKEALLALKMSHRYLKNSPHFLKTMRDIQAMRAAGVVMTPELEDLWLPQREAETYVYAHPKLDVSKGEFFSGDGVQYVYDHDSLHLTQALVVMAHHCDHTPGGFEYQYIPAYTNYMVDGAQVMTSKDKFFAVPEKIRLYGVYEETCVLALERSQIPYGFEPPARWSFEMALMKVCTSITSGWFREFAWENYNAVIDLYEQLGENDYIERFKGNAHLLKPFKGE